jgi:TPR repeat protein
MAAEIHIARGGITDDERSQSSRRTCRRAAHAMSASAADTSSPYDQAIDTLDAYDDPRAVEQLRAVATSGDLRAQRLLGFMLLYGDRFFPGVRSDRTEALEWLRKAANRGDEAAAFVVRRADQRIVGTAPR